MAGEAGVPFLSVSGSDFMEMFVGVGASRVRDLFQTARKQAPAIVFVDEIDSIGRKRGAGLGGGHDEREQTLNQMLSEMDGFDPAEGVVMMAATNRPDILDPALLRPGRFDRQIVVPLPDLEERLPILQVHCRGKRMGPDVDLELVARGTPGMSGADLANLVNEAALHAVRRGSHVINMVDFESARDRVLMGQRRESLVLSDEEKERVAYHEGGHAVLAYVLPHADPVHKVTILPTGMALGVTQQLPLEERHIHPRAYIEDALCVRMGGRVAELLVYGDLSTGAANDLVGNTELARKMVREWGMSEQIGPMAWGSQGQVFLGEDLMHSRDYSESTSRVIDDEVERILRDQEQRAIEMLTPTPRRTRGGGPGPPRARDRGRRGRRPAGRRGLRSSGPRFRGEGGAALPRQRQDGIRHQRRRSSGCGRSPGGRGRHRSAGHRQRSTGFGRARPRGAGERRPPHRAEPLFGRQGRERRRWTVAVEWARDVESGGPALASAQPASPLDAGASATAGSPPPPPPPQAGWAPPRWAGPPADGGKGLDQYANPQHPGRQNANDQYANPQHPPGPAEPGPAQPDAG